jgi:RNA polymerase sigma-70 factor (ECF subfamily)
MALEQNTIVVTGALEAFGRASEAELAAAFALCRERAFWIALDIVRDREEAADLVHEAYLSAQRTLPRFRGECSLRSYLLRLVVNLALKVTRARRVRERLRHLLLPWAEQREPRSPEALASGAEQSRALRAALERLPGQQRAAFLLRHGHELPIAEVAEVLAVSEGTVKTHLARAVERLRRELEEVRG